MTTETKKKTKFTRSATFKGLMIAALTLVMLIPSCMVQELIAERKTTRDEAVRNIDAKWSYAQTVNAPVLVVPYSYTKLDKDDKPYPTVGYFTVTPENVRIESVLLPEERYYGIYKTILYNSKISVEGNFPSISPQELPKGKINWENAYIKFGVTDLRGISDDIKFEIDDKQFTAQATGEQDALFKQVLKVTPQGIKFDDGFDFSFGLDLKGSGSINFTPIGRRTTVMVSGDWKDPGFIGNYTPEYEIDGEGFSARWKILNYNRAIPDTWTGNLTKYDYEVSFGVNLVDTVDIYQQNMRSAKYALMFIALTFVIFFFVEVIGKKRIHPIQYALVGIALILFYSLLLSISEPLGFGWAYLISSAATIGLITVYASTMFKNVRLTLGLGVILSFLYLLLYVILQLEDMALLAGSVGLFIILGIIMYFSRKINWYSEEN
ncbi:MAG: cell envelope integrity protein CreD [Rikenellaceae bacterium]|nr:cell envelope integrity protein CreD [Rikenellaceae bacterium]